jgi:isoleucyl-tRNA synthetase
VAPAYESYAFHTVHHALHNFCAVTLSSLYFDILKDRLYTSVAWSRERRSAQTALHRIGHAVCRLMAPILPFTADEIWQELPRVAGDPESVHLALFPASPGDAASPDRAVLRREREALLAVREQVLPALEAERRAQAIGGALEACVTLRAEPVLHALLAAHRDELPFLFIVSAVELEPGPEGSALSVGVRRAEGSKCARCWNVLPSVGADPELATLCDRCATAVRAIRKGRS